MLFRSIPNGVSGIQESSTKLNRFAIGLNPFTNFTSPVYCWLRMEILLSITRLPQTAMRGTFGRKDLRGKRSYAG